jgi:curved DNA-binding protein CbpA
MIEIEKKDFEAVVDEIISTRDLRLIIEKSLKNHHHYRSIILDISKGSKSRNFRIINEISKNKKISDRFIVDQAKSVISFFNPGDEGGIDDYYKILECSQESDDEVIRSNWIRLMKLYHPDKIGESGLEKTKKINEAYNILIDPASREHYDKSYFPDIPVRIKNLNYIQFKNRRFLAVMTSLLLLVPIFYIYKNFTGPDVNTEYSEKPADNTDSNETNNDKSSNEITKNETIVDTGINVADTQNTVVDNGADVALDRQENVNPLDEEEYDDDKDAVNDFDEVKTRTVVQKPELDENLEVTEQDGLNEPEETEIALVETYENDIDQTVYVEDDSVVKSEVEADIDNKSPDPSKPQKYIVKKGDSLWSLSNKFDVSVNEIKKQNSINKDSIKLGDSLILSRTDDNAGAEKESDVHVTSEIDKNLKDAGKKISIASSNKVIDEVKTSNKKASIKKNKARKVSNIGELELSSIKGSSINPPNKSSVYTAISDYIFAYKNRDMKKLGTLFDVDAKENGVSMDKVFQMYKKNFEALNIVAYDIKFNKVNLDKRKATVYGDFIISFTNTSKDVFKKSYGDINWKLTWNDDSWLIDEIRYNVTSTKVGDEFNR